MPAQPITADDLIARVRTLGRRAAGRYDISRAVALRSGVLGGATIAGAGEDCTTLARSSATMPGDMAGKSPNHITGGNTGGSAPARVDVSSAADRAGLRLHEVTYA